MLFCVGTKKDTEHALTFLVISGLMQVDHACMHYASDGVRHQTMCAFDRPSSPGIMCVPSSTSSKPGGPLSSVPESMV